MRRVGTILDYRYPLLSVKRILDGDTIDAVLGKDIGFNVQATATVRLRLLGVDCPKLGVPGGAEASQFTADWLNRWRLDAMVETHKTESFGRWLAYVYVPEDKDRDRPHMALTADLVVNGHAVPWKPRPR